MASTQSIVGAESQGRHMSFFSSLKGRLFLMVLCLSLAPVAVLGVGAVWLIGELNTTATNAVDAEVNAELDAVAAGAYKLVESQNTQTQERVDQGLKVARYVLDSSGVVSQAPEQVGWTAINQFTQDEKVVQLPKLLVGDTWLGQNRELQVETPIVDRVAQLGGATATLFQRMNEQSDMLRVATNVETADGIRAIGTYIPATNPDGNPNPVVATALKGDTYRAAQPSLSKPGM